MTDTNPNRARPTENQWWRRGIARPSRRRKGALSTKEFADDPRATAKIFAPVYYDNIQKVNFPDINNPDENPYIKPEEFYPKKTDISTSQEITGRIDTNAISTASSEQLAREAFPPATSSEARPGTWVEAFHTDETGAIPATKAPGGRER